jgi:hypothetical protein
MLTNYIESIWHQIKYKSTPVNKLIHIFDNKIICLTLNNTDIRLGDLIFAKTVNENCGFNYGLVKELQMKKRNYPKIRKKKQSVRWQEELIFMRRVNRIFIY